MNRAMAEKAKRRHLTFTLPNGQQLPVSLLVGASCFFLMIAAYLLTLVIPGWDAYQISTQTFAGASGEHWLGTDNLGRDSFVRIAQAASLGIFISACSALLAAVIGTSAGIYAAYRGGLVEKILMRGTDLFLAIPAILMALMIRVIVGPGVAPLIVSLGVIFSPVFARVMHATALSITQRDFVTASRIAGRSGLAVSFRHILPNASTPLFVAFASVASEAVVLEAALSYLGQGVQAPNPSAGRMIDEFQKYALTHPQLIVLPCIAIVLIASAWNLLADGLQVLFMPRRGTPAANATAVPLATTPGPSTDPGIPPVVSTERK